jgi:hypothetical protein
MFYYLKPGETFYLSCMEATPNVEVFCAGAQWEEIAGQVDYYRYSLTLIKTGAGI